MQLKKIDKCLNPDDFKNIYISEDLGIGKPDKLAFHKLIKSEDLDVKDTIMIGDRYKSDIIPAREVGFNAVLFDRYNRNKEDIPKVKDLISFYKIIERRKM